MEFYSTVAVTFHKTMDDYKKIYMVGIGGIGMTALALILHAMGKRVTGSDSPDFHSTDKILDKHNITYVRGFNPKTVPHDIDLMITTGAHGGLHNKEVLKAKERGVPILTHGEALGLLMNSFTTGISVCGTHGKTTTSGMAAYVFHELKKKFAYQIGTLGVSGLPPGGYTGKDYMVVESDEYVSSPGIDNTPKFMFQSPKYAICTNIDHDHIDVYPTLSDVKKAFRAFFEKLSENKGTLIYCIDDKNTHMIAGKMKNLRTITYGQSPEADIMVGKVKRRSQGGITYTVKIAGSKKADVHLKVPGLHNALNAASVIALCHVQKFDVDACVKALGSFTGTKTRFEKISGNAGYTLIADYAHHPREVEVTVDALKEQYPGKNIIVIFQPHTLSRTKKFEKEFIRALSGADTAYITDIYASAREKDDESITAEKVVSRARKMGLKHVHYLQSEKAADTLKEKHTQGNVYAIIGAGSFLSEYGNDIMLKLQST